MADRYNKAVQYEESSAEDDEQIHVPNNPPMPGFVALRQVQSLNFQCSQKISSTRSDDIDFALFKDITANEDCPEWNGYNTKSKINRESGQSPGKKPQLSMFHSHIAYLTIIQQ